MLSGEDGSDGGGFHGPSIDEYFPPAIFFEGTPFELNRVMLIRIIVVIALALIFLLGTRRMKVIPGRGQAALEAVLGFVRNSIVIQTLGEKDGKRFMGVIMTIFFVTLGMNLTGVIPPFLLAGTAVIGLPMIMGVLAWVLFIYAGIKKHGFGGYAKASLIIPGVPVVLVPMLAALEFLSTFILRPVTLTLRLLMNMIAGHMLLVLAFSATHFFLFTLLADGNPLGLMGIGSFAIGFAFTLFELFVAALQAYVFAILTAIYIQLAISDGH